MDTHEELARLASDLKRAATTHRRATTFLSILIVMTCLIIVYLIGFYIDKSVHEAVERENISGLIEVGFDRAIQNYEIAE